MGIFSSLLGLAMFLCTTMALLYPGTSSAVTCEQWVAKVVSVQGTVEARRAGQIPWEQVKLRIVSHKSRRTSLSPIDEAKAREITGSRSNERLIAGKSSSSLQKLRMKLSSVPRYSIPSSVCLTAKSLQSLVM